MDPSRPSRVNFAQVAGSPYLVDLVDGILFFLEKRRKRVENIRASGRTRSRQIDVSVSRIRRSLRSYRKRRSDERTE